MEFRQWGRERVGLEQVNQHPDNTHHHPKQLNYNSASSQQCISIRYKLWGSEVRNPSVLSLILCYLHITNGKVSLITPKPCIHSYSLLNVQGVQLHLENQLTASYLIPCPTEQLSQAALYNCNKPTNCLKYKLGHIISFLWEARDFKVDWYWVFWPKKCKRRKLRRKPEKQSKES